MPREGALQSRTILPHARLPGQPSPGHRAPRRFKRIANHRGELQDGSPRRKALWKHFFKSLNDSGFVPETLIVLLEKYNLVAFDYIREKPPMGRTIPIPIKTQYNPFLIVVNRLREQRQGAKTIFADPE